jgi:uncharacterized membrane protein YvbJ
MNKLIYHLNLTKIIILLAMKEVKCTNCKQWNADLDHCSNCGEPISSRQLNINYRQQIEEEDNERPPSKIDTYFAKQMKSTNVGIKLLFYFLYSVWMIYMTILGFFLYLIVGTPG